MHEAVAVTIILVAFMTGLYFIVAAGFSGRKASALIRARADLSMGPSPIVSRQEARSCFQSRSPAITCRTLGSVE